jgi:predicted RNA-binding Zn-ribbon protein involved in translation (DUF1610 family)
MKKVTMAQAQEAYDNRAEPEEGTELWECDTCGQVFDRSEIVENHCPYCASEDIGAVTYERGPVDDFDDDIDEEPAFGGRDYP